MHDLLVIQCAPRPRFEAGVVAALTDATAMECLGPHAFRLRGAHRHDGLAAHCEHEGIDFAVRARTMSPYDERALDFHLSFEVEQDYGGDAADLSNWWYDQDSWLGGRQDSYMVDGYSELTDTLADDLDIRLNTTVSAVTFGDSGVRVTTNRSTEQAAYAVMTVPLGVLKANRISFSPALSRAKRSAIDRLGVGTLNKLYLGFGERFWDDHEAIGYQGERRGEWSLWMDMERILGEPVLVVARKGRLPGP